MTATVVTEREAFGASLRWLGVDTVVGLDEVPIETDVLLIDYDTIAERVLTGGEVNIGARCRYRILLCEDATLDVLSFARDYGAGLDMVMELPLAAFELAMLIAKFDSTVQKMERGDYGGEG